MNSDKTGTSVESPNPLELRDQEPLLSAGRVLYPGQLTFVVLALAALAWALARAPLQTGVAVVAVSTVFYLVFTLYKLLLTYYSVMSEPEIRIAPADVAALTDEECPVYSVLVPLYHESETVANLVAALHAMDYPADRLDVQLLVEDDDIDTQTALQKVTLPQGFRITPIPPSLPRTKPKACNIGLASARGKYLVIYDAEDRPEADQLKKAVVAFQRVEPGVTCLQSKLNYYNPRYNLLTRWFSAEYSAWFDFALPGLCGLGGLVPLGGTSNHFVTAVLRDVRGWDAFNVTEDCDLGVRLYRKGYQTRMLDTTTWEEACSRWHFWIRQRTRWLKGYMQTYLVHTRRPWQLHRELGLRNTIHFHMLVGGIVACFLLNPVYWLLALVWFAFRAEALRVLFPGPVFFLGAMCLFAGNFAFIYSGALGCFRRRRFDLVKYALLVLPYWGMMSYSGWRAFFQLFTRPFHWEKTRHGLDTSQSSPTT